MNKKLSAGGRKGAKKSPWGRYPHVPRQHNYQRMRDWHLAEKAKKEGE